MPFGQDAAPTAVPARRGGWGQDPEAAPRPAASPQMRRALELAGAVSDVVSANQGLANDVQTRALINQRTAGRLDLTAPAGTDRNPWVVADGHPAPPPGHAFYDRAGQLHPASAPLQAAYARGQAKGHSQPATSFMETVNRAIPGFDEASAGLGAVEDTVAGAQPNLGAAWDARRAEQSGRVDAFHAEHPNLAGTATGVGNAAQVIPALMTGGASLAADAPTIARAPTIVGRAIQTAAQAAKATPRLAAAGAAYAGVNAFADRGTMAERLNAAGGALVPGAVAGVAIPAGFNAIKGAAKAVIAPLRNAMDPFLAATSNTAARRVAGARLAGAASDLPATRNALNDAPVPSIVGDHPTTFQQTGDLGIGAAEKGQAAKTPEPFKARAAEQNSARLEHLRGVQSGGDPVAVARSVTAALEELDAQHAGTVQQATAHAQAAANAVGGAGTPEGYGAALRTTLTDAEGASKQRMGALYGAIDPEGTATANVTATSAAARDITGSIPPTAKPMDGEESAIFQAASGLSPVTPLRDLIALRSRVSAEMMNTRETDPQANRRLTQLRGAIETNLETSIGERVASEATGVQGQVAAENSIEQRVQALRAKWSVPAQATARAGSGSSGAGYVAGGTAPVSVVRGTGSETIGGPGNAAGNPGLPSDAGQPTVDPATVGQLKAATAAARTHHDIFDVQPVSGVLRTQGVAGRYAMPDGSVPASVWNGKPNEADMVTRAIGAGGPQALAVLQDHAAADLRASAMTDGVIDPARFAAWRTRHAGGLRAMPPELQARFADAAAAGQTVGDAAVARTAALKAARQGATARFLGLTDPDAVTKTVGGLFGKPNATSQMRQIVQSVRNDPEALAGLRQAVADHITSRLVSNTEAATSGENLLKADAFQSFVRANRPALAEVFGPEELGRLDAIAESLHSAARSNNALRTAGSDTAQNQSLIARLFSAAGDHAISTGGTIMGAALGSAHHGGTEGATIGAVGGGLIGAAVKAWRAVGVENINQLFTQALLNPEVARALLAHVPIKGAATSPSMLAATRRLSAALARSAGVGTATVRAQPAAPANAMTAQAAPMTAMSGNAMRP